MNEQLPDTADLLISILPMHAARIYSGRKVFELRKVLPRELPRRIFLYETEKARITGHIVVEKVISADPKKLWDATGPKGTTKGRFFRYFSDKKVGHAYKILCAVKYKTPLKVNGESADVSHPVPQNFIYLETFPHLHRVLREMALSESFESIRAPFRCRPISQNNKAEFIRLVNKHISGSYAETGIKYARKLIQVHNQGEDTEGIFSLRKIIFEIVLRKKLIGFFVLTEKIGGCIKTGPVVFRKGFVHRGFGRKLRGQLHAALRPAGYRKVYCTVPAINDAAVRYLLGSGYRIEAHLQRQYHDGHDEFVLGYPLVDDRGPTKDFVRPNTPASRVEKISKQSLPVAAFMQQEFSISYGKLPTDWAAQQIKYAVSKTRSKSKFKPREVYVAAAQEEVLSVALCIPKRGGGTKVLLATRTAHIDSLVRVIQRIEFEAKKSRARKLYTLVSVVDVILQRVFYQCGFRPEGVLDRPYQPSDDLIVLSKMVP
ncbi:MAG: hypothetical protein K8F25_18770 [Fimbriimonadaceae bacterium]|nr:hypothetical protein [Alphaproteobacteria bacterium]